LAEFKPTATARIQTGVPGLDEVMAGGLVPGRTVMIKGEPGSGKTTLGLQMLVAGARQFGEAGVMIAFEQTPAQIMGDMAAFGWDLPALAEQQALHVLCVAPEEILNDPKRQANRLLVNIADLVDEFGARRVLIDSVSHLAAHFARESERAQFLGFLNELKRLGLTPIMTAELKPEEGIAGVEAYLVDTLIVLERRASRLGIRELRTLQIVKSRGCPHLGGEHPFEITARGIAVYPHSFPDEIEYEIDEPEEGAPAGLGEGSKIPTGVPGLNELLGGGYGEGSVIMVAGLSGTFKTTMAAHFLLSGGEDAPPGALAHVSGRRRGARTALRRAGPGSARQARPGAPHRAAGDPRPRTRRETARARRRGDPRARRRPRRDR
jgi:circadian clock protein KaiC